MPLHAFDALMYVLHYKTKGTLSLVVSNLTFTCLFFLFQIEHKPLSLGEVLDGDRMAKSLYEIKFKRKYSENYIIYFKIPMIYGTTLLFVNVIYHI